MERRAFLQTPAALAAIRLGIEKNEAGLVSSFDPWVEVHRENLAHNVSEIRRRVEKRPILAVIKNNGYGAGVSNVARLLEPSEGILGFAVVKLQEAAALRDAG